MVNLLPRKEFELILNGQTIEGKYCLWAIKRMCDKKKWSIKDLSVQLSADKMTFDDLCEFILCAVEYKVRKNKKPFMYTDVDVCDWLEELGGVDSEEVTALMNHAHSEIEEKKSIVNPQPGESLKPLEVLQD